MRGGARTWIRTIPGRAVLSLLPLLLAGGVLAASAGGLTSRSPSPAATGPAKADTASAVAPPHLTTTSTKTSSTSSSTTSSTTTTTGPQTAQNESAHDKTTV